MPETPALTDALESLHDLGPGERAEPLATLALAEAIDNAATTLAAALADAQRQPITEAPQRVDPLDLSESALRRDAEGAPTHYEVYDHIRNWRRQGVDFDTILAAVERVRQVEAHG